MTRIFDLPLFDSAPAFTVPRNADWQVDMVLVARGSPKDTTALSCALIQGRADITAATGLGPCVAGQPLFGPGIQDGAVIQAISGAHTFTMSLPATITDPVANIVADPLGADLAGIMFEAELKRSVSDRVPRFRITTTNGYFLKMPNGRLRINVPQIELMAVPADSYVMDILAIDPTVPTPIKRNLCANVGAGVVTIYDAVTDQ